jgi:predicted dehydrogenase
MSAVRFGLVGVGGFARVHLNAISGLEQKGKASLAATVIRNRAKYPQQVLDLESRGVRLYESLEAMLAAGGFDIVALPTGIQYHVPQTVACLEAGYHVVCEKPVAARIQDADRMLNATRASGRHVLIGYQAIFTHAIQSIKACILEGRIGRIRSICVKGGWPRNDAYYTRNAWAGKLRVADDWILDSPINNAFAHDVNNALFLCGAGQLASADPVSVQAELYRARKIQSPDTASLRIRTVEGVEIVIALSHVTAENFDPSLAVRGDSGTVLWAQANGVTTITCADGSTETLDNGGVQVHDLPFENAVQVLQGNASPMCTPGNARSQTLAINGAHESCPDIVDFPSGLVSETLDPQADASSRFLRVSGLDDLIHRSFEEGKLFSELGVEWARPTRTFNLDGYSSFPSRPLPI